MRLACPAIAILGWMALLGGCRTVAEPRIASSWTEADAARPLSHDDCVRLASEWAPNRAAWEARLLHARATLRQACAFPNPTLNLTWEDFAIYPGSTAEKVQTTASLAWSLEALFSRRNRIIAARGDLDAEEMTIATEWLKLAAAVHRAYDGLMGARAKVAIERDLEAVAERQREVTSKVVGAGVAPRIGLDRAEAELATARAERAKAEAEARAAELEFAFALGFEKPVTLQLSEPMTAEPATAPEDLGPMLEQAAAQRPEIRAALAKSRAGLARYQIAADRVQFLPTIGAGPRTQGGEWRGVASIDVVLPISDSGAPAEAAARAGALEAAADVRKAAQKVAGEVWMAAERLRLQSDFLEKHAKDVANKRTALRTQTDRLFGASEATLDDAMLSRRDEVSARLALLEAEIAVALARIDLNAATGALTNGGRRAPIPRSAHAAR